MGTIPVIDRSSLALADDTLDIQALLHETVITTASKSAVVTRSDVRSRAYRRHKAGCRARRLPGRRCGRLASGRSW